MRNDKYFFISIFVVLVFVVIRLLFNCHALRNELAETHIQYKNAESFRRNIQQKRDSLLNQKLDENLIVFCDTRDRFDRLFQSGDFFLMYVYSEDCCESCVIEELSILQADCHGKNRSMVVVGNNKRINQEFKIWNELIIFNTLSPYNSDPLNKFPLVFLVDMDYSIRNVYIPNLFGESEYARVRRSFEVSSMKTDYALN